MELVVPVCYDKRGGLEGGCSVRDQMVPALLQVCLNLTELCREMGRRHNTNLGAGNALKQSFSVGILSLR